MRSQECIALVGGYHGVDVATLPLEQSNFGLQIVDLLREELDEVQ